jgi:hypothetical protein
VNNLSLFIIGVIGYLQISKDLAVSSSTYAGFESLMNQQFSRGKSSFAF